MPETILSNLHVISHLFLSCLTHEETRTQNCHMTCSNLHSWLVRLLLPSRFSRVWLCDPVDGSPPGSPVPGILQERTLEWVAISLSKLVNSNRYYFQGQRRDLYAWISIFFPLWHLRITYKPSSFWWSKTKSILVNKIYVLWKNVYSIFGA